MSKLDKIVEDLSALTVLEAADLAYQAILYENRTVAGNINPTVNGTYRTTLHVGSINLRVNF